MRSKTLCWKEMFVLSALILLFGGTSVAIAAHHEGQKTTASDVKKETMETYDVLKSYTLEQRNEAMDVAQKKIDKLDSRISEMQKIVNALRTVTVDVEKMPYNPLDDVGYQKVKVGDMVRVRGTLDKSFLVGNEVVAKSITKLYN